MPELVGACGGGETMKEFEVEATGGDNEGLEEGASCHAADVSKPKGSITIVPCKRSNSSWDTFVSHLCPT